MILIDDSSIKVGSVVIPGLYKGMDIEGSVILEEVKVEGAKKIPKQAVGYEDHKITLTVELCDSEDQSRWEKLRIIQHLFKEPSEDKPKPYDFISQHTQLRGIAKVLFKKLSSSESAKNDALIVNLEFVEYEALKITATSSSAKAKKAASSSGMKKEQKSRRVPPSVATREYQEYLKTRGKSPSVDNRKPRKIGGNLEF